MTILALGQANDRTNKISKQKDTIVRTMPIFQGGMKRIEKIIADNMEYPDSALNENLGGKVITQFVIDSSGNISYVKIIKGIRRDLDNEAIRLIKLLNGWTPATENGKKVRAAFQLPLTFVPDKRLMRKYKKKYN